MLSVYRCQSTSFSCPHFPHKTKGKHSLMYHYRELWGGVAPKVHKLMCISASRRRHNELGPKGFFEFI